MRYRSNSHHTFGRVCYTIIFTVLRALETLRGRALASRGRRYRQDLRASYDVFLDEFYVVSLATSIYGRNTPRRSIHDSPFADHRGISTSNVPYSSRALPYNFRSGPTMPVLRPKDPQEFARGIMRWPEERGILHALCESKWDSYRNLYKRGHALIV